MGGHGLRGISSGGTMRLAQAHATQTLEGRLKLHLEPGTWGRENASVPVEAHRISREGGGG